MIPVQPWQTWCMFRLSPQLFLKYYRYDLLIKKKKKKLRCVCLCTCVDLFGIWVRRTGEHSGGKEGHGITYPHSVIEYGRLLVMPKSVRSPCPVSLSVCPAWNFCLILRWGEEAISSMSFGAEGILYCIPPPKLCKLKCASKAICHIKHRLQIYVYMQATLTRLRLPVVFQIPRPHLKINHA